MLKGALNPEIHGSLYERKYTFKAINHKDTIQLGPMGQKSVYSSSGQPYLTHPAAARMSCVQ